MEMQTQSDLVTGAWREWDFTRKVRLLQTLRSVNPALAMALDEWTRKYRPELVPDRRLDFENHPYLLALYQSAARELCVFKASQMGASEYLISYAFHACDKRSATVLYVFPTDTHVSDFSSSRIGPAIEASEYLQGIVVDAGGRSRGADRVRLKRIGNRFMYCRGAKVGPLGQAPQLKSVDADIVILDEVDEMDKRAVPIARKRLGHSHIAELRAVSTPTYRGAGIHVWWLDSDQREWFVRCDSCGKRQFMTRAHVIIEYDDLDRPVAWHGKEEGRAFPACEDCGAELDRLQVGEWVARYPGRSRQGFHLTKLFSPYTDVQELVLPLLDLDQTARKECINQDWGETYVPTGGQLTEEMLDDCRREYLHRPVGREQCRMGVDVGKLLHVVIRGPEELETGERAQRFAGTVTHFSDIHDLMKRYRVKVGVVDALPETRAAREFQESCRQGVIWLAYYVTQKTGSKKEKPIQRIDEEGVVNLDRTRTLDDMMAGIMQASTGRGGFTLPASARAIPDYYKQMQALVRVLEEHKGGKVAVYHSDGDDHYAHAENYCAVACELPSAVSLPQMDGLRLAQSRWAD